MKRLRWMCLESDTHILWGYGVQARHSIIKLTSSLFFQPDQDAVDNFDAVNLSWVKCTIDPLKVLKHGLDFLQDPSKINGSNREAWCNLHVTPTLKGIMVEVCSLEEVTYWAKKGCLGSDSDPMEPGVANLIVAFGSSPWPCTLSLARVHVAPNQKMCSLIEAGESAKKHFTVIGTVYPNIPLSSASLHGHPQSSLGATLGVRMSVTAYGNLSTMSCVWPIGASRLNLRPCPLSI